MEKSIVVTKALTPWVTCRTTVYKNGSPPVFTTERPEWNAQLEGLKAKLESEAQAVFKRRSSDAEMLLTGTTFDHGEGDPLEPPTLKEYRMAQPPTRLPVCRPSGLATLDGQKLDKRQIEGWRRLACNVLSAASEEHFEPLRWPD